MRKGLIVLWMLFCSVTSAVAQVSIGINLNLYPELVRVPGYPVYYAPQLDSNYFFYDGMYWVYQSDSWYASSWYNGPWALVDPELVPLFILRIPVRYYRHPPGNFNRWRSDAAPRWGEHWGREWEQRRSGWDRWDRRSAPSPAPLPVYQREYSGDRYPHAEQQRELHSQKYRYRPRDSVVREHYQEHAVPRSTTPSSRREQGASEERSSRRQDGRHSEQPQIQQSAPAAQRSQMPQRAGEGGQRAAPTDAPRQQWGTERRDQSRQQEQRALQPERESPRSSRETMPQGRGAPQEQRRKQAEEREREQDRERGQGRDR